MIRVFTLIILVSVSWSLPILAEPELSNHAVDEKEVDETASEEVPSESSFLSTAKHFECVEDNDCTVLTAMCSHGWFAVQSEYAEIGKKVFSSRKSEIDCQNDYFVPIPSCVMQRCVVLPDADMCMSRKTSGECVIKCDMIDEHGICQHSCFAGQPCD